MNYSPTFFPEKDVRLRESFKAQITTCRMMNKQQFRHAIRDLLDETGLEWEEKTTIIRKQIIQTEKSRNTDLSNKGKPWTDDELRLILSSPPTQENCMRLAKAFNRGYESIELIFRWAATSQKIIDQRRKDHSFIAQIKRVAKDVGWRAE